MLKKCALSRLHARIAGRGLFLIPPMTSNHLLVSVQAAILMTKKCTVGCLATESGIRQLLVAKRPSDSGYLSMDEKEKREALKKVPTRKLLASIKRDLRRAVRASASAAKPKRK